VKATSNKQHRFSWFRERHLEGFDADLLKAGCSS